MARPERQIEGEPYTILNERPIGKGAYSEVFEGRTVRGRRVAVKTACKRVEIKAMGIEVEILKKLRGDTNIVQLIGSRHDYHPPGSVVAETFSFAMEYAHGSLETEMRRPQNSKGLPADVLFDLVVDCSMALSALHRKNIAHRDIKHMNILLFPGSRTHGRRSDLLFKLCDMGCSKELLQDESHEMSTLVGTPKLLHPRLAKEMLDPRLARNQHNYKTKEPYTPDQCDLWSLGCTLYFCATGKFPIDHEKDQEYFAAVNAMGSNPDAIGMQVIVKKTARGETRREFEPITVLPVRHTRYPKWFEATLTCLIRQFFHEPSITRFAEVAKAMRTAKRKQFLSIDQLTVMDHTDMSQVPYIGFSVPSLSECLGYAPGTNLLLVSNTACVEFDSKCKPIEKLQGDVFLVVPQQSEVPVRKIFARNIKFDETETMNDRQLAEVRLSKCYEGYSMLAEMDEYSRLFEMTSQILATQFCLLVDELYRFEPIQMASRFAVYLETMSTLMMMFDKTSPASKNTSSQCIQRAKQARAELEHHAKHLMDIEQKAKQLAKDAAAIRLDEIDLAGMPYELEMYAFDTKVDVLASTDYSNDLIEQIYDQRNLVMRQIFKSADGVSSKIQNAVDVSASLTSLRSECEKVQKLMSGCVDLLERPFQEMKAVVNRDLQERGCSSNSMSQSAHLLSTEFRDEQRRVRSATRVNADLIKQLNNELAEIRRLGFERIGDTLLREKTQVQTETKVGEPETEQQTTGGETVNETVLTYSDSEISGASFVSTDDDSAGSSYFQAVMQFFSKPPEA